MPEFVKVAEVGEVPPGEMMRVEVGDVSAVLVNLDGEYYAINALCTHEEGDLDEGELEGTCLTCPLHGSQFDIRTGEVLGEPAEEPVASYPVQVEGSGIKIAVA